MTPETRLKNRVVAALKSVDALVLKVHGHALQAPGWPDLQVYHVSWFGHLELKCGRAVTSTAQRLIIAQLRRRGFPAYVLRDRADPRLDDVSRLQLEDASGIGIGSELVWDGTGRALLDHIIAVTV